MNYLKNGEFDLITNPDLRVEIQVFVIMEEKPGVSIDAANETETFLESNDDTLLAPFS